MFEWLAGRVDPVAVRPRRAVCRGPEGHVRAPGARPHRRAAGGEEHARCRAGPHGAGGRADPGGRARRVEVDGLVAARARTALPGRGRAAGAQREGAGEAAGGGRGVCRRGGHRGRGLGDRRGGQAGEPHAGRGAGRGPRGGVDATLTEVATTRPHAELAQVVHHYLARLDEDGPEPDPTQGRVLSLAKHADGSVTGRFELDALGGEKLQTALEALVQAGRCAGDERTRGQQLADALVQLADNALAAGGLPVLRTVKPHVIVRIDAEDLFNPAVGPGAASLGSSTLISAARARWAACDATITRILLGPDGAILDLGRDARVVTPQLRKAVEHRDRRCVFAGCAAPAWWCDVHHLLEWINGGQTSLENSALLCERHHTKVHHGFRVERLPDGRWRTWRPRWNRDPPRP